ncbi:MAG: thermonuclease family protein [Candidatus Pacebacteria bacterium]|nr:thermonuclease family protein [Candidatus Paceibacterota bacterium]
MIKTDPVGWAVNILIFLLLSGAAFAEDLRGIPRVVDGDTLYVVGVKVRLHGIDAFEKGQPCTINGVRQDCGRLAKAWLSTTIGRKEVHCVGGIRDRYKRLIGKCYVDGMDLGEGLVAAGWALAYRRYSAEYVDEEDSAKTDRRGAWSGVFVEPWVWRRKR